ncbi:MAG: response regulator [Desulfobacteraceae bacterium]|nr:response regulator [Desulfobacteraceae bacterium]
MDSSCDRHITDNKAPVILIVDDNPTNLSIIVNYFKDSGFRLVEACDGETALELAASHGPDLILLDILMPGLDGFEVCRQFKSNDATKEIPVIFMTSLADTEDKVKGFRAGAVDYITKPFQHEEVVARVHAHLRIAKLTQNLQEQNKQLEALTQALSSRANLLEISSEVGRQITSILDLNRLLTEIVTLIQSRFGFFFVGIWLLSDDATMILKAASGSEGSELIGAKVPIGKTAPRSIIKRIAQTKEPYLATDISTDAYYYSMNPFSISHSEFVVPLVVGGEIIGALDMIIHEKDRFTTDDRKLLQTIADQISIAIQNARLYELEKNLREMLEDKANSLTELNASKDKFFSIFSHDLRNPFSVLMTTAEVLLMNLDRQNKDKIRKKAQVIFDAAKSTLNLLDNLLTWSRIQRGHMKFLPDRANLQSIVGNTYKLFAENAAKKEIQLEDLTDESVYVHADRNMIDLVIRNLVGNAIKFTPMKGRVTISAVLRPRQNGDARPVHSPKGRLVEVCVEDTGVGIGVKEMGYLFKLDVHHTTLGTANEQGTGLGLILCREMVEKNGGQIKVESEVGSGSTFKFTIPEYV